MTNKEFADILLPNVKHDYSYYEEKYKSRNLDDKAIVTRYAPSPTGLPHMGNLFQCFMASSFAKQSGGVFYLRIEDTDTERTIENGIEKILEALRPFDINFDEGAISQTEEKGEYGPYIQSQRKDIYQAYAKKLIEEDKAYASFATKEELDEIRKEQEVSKQRIGYYGKWAKDKFITKEEAVKRIKAGEEYIIRLKSPGNFFDTVVFNDLIKGKIEMPQNDIDEVLIKKDGLPTYHFAHAIDDHLMHTTHVIRGDEWVSSTNKHIQLFEVLGFDVPKYAHLAPLNKMEDGKVRKLSKRKDPEATLMYYVEQGIPKEAVMLYLATITNSNFEGWLDQNPLTPISEFKFDFAKANSSNGSLFDLPKLLNISKNYISRLSKDEVFNRLDEYTKNYDLDFNKIINDNKERTLKVLNIEREQKKPRKDYAKFSDIKENVWYMYDELWNEYDKNYEWQSITNIDDINAICNTYIDKYFDENDDKETWFNKVKELSSELGYSPDVKAYKENPENFKGHVGDVSTVLRVALTTRCQTPDLYEIMIILGKDKMKERFELIK